MLPLTYLLTYCLANITTVHVARRICSHRLMHVIQPSISQSGVKQINSTCLKNTR